MISEREKLVRVPRRRPIPTIGWVLISRTDVGNAEKLLLAEDQGMVDELGLLAIHQAVADQLFPGTSVLHTRLRYALFVPWLMQRAARDNDPVAALRSLEYKLTGQLIHGARNDSVGRKGIIGARVHRHNQFAAQPPSYSYWTALSAWGILGREYVNAQTSRETVLALLAEASRGNSSVRDEAGELVGGSVSLFEGLPDAPDNLLDDPEGTTFSLSDSEAAFLQRRLTAVKTPGDRRESLLASLARSPIALRADMTPWSGAVRERASSEDRKILQLARHASALGGIARAVYLALVEHACQRQGLKVESNHAGRLQDLRRDSGEDAAKLDLNAMREHGLGLGSDRLFALLTRTQQWLGQRNSFTCLEEIYRDIERQRKKDHRARLAGTPAAAAHLRAWADVSAKSKPAEPLHFRWPQVARMIGDLHGL